MNPHCASWREARLGDIAEFINGGAWSQDEYTEAGVPVVRVTNLQNSGIDLSDCKFLAPEALTRYAKHRLKADDLIIATVGSHPSQPASVVGRPAVVRPQIAGALLNQNAVIVRSKIASIDQRWLTCFGRSKIVRDYVIACARGSANQVRMSIGLLKDLRVLVPPLDTQRRIAGILSAYDDLIENNERRIAILEEIARRVFREWFVDFRFPGYETVRPTETDVGRIPEGWVRANLYDVADVTYGFPFKSQHFSSDPVGVSVARIRDVLAGRSETYTEEEFDSRYDLADGDLLVGMDGIFHTAIWSGGKAALNQRVARLRPKGGHSTMWLMLSVLPAIKTLEATIVGTTVAHLSARDLKALTVICAPDHLQHKADELLRGIQDTLRTLKKQNARLRASRDLLLPRLISGELNVTNAERMLEAAE